MENDASTARRHLWKPERHLRVHPLWLLPFVLLAGCGNKREIKLMGQWKGDFTPDDPMAKPMELKGFMQIYANNNYKLHLEGVHQTFEINGKWKLDKDRLVLNRVGDPTGEFPTKEDIGTFHWNTYSMDDLRKGYERLIFKVSTNELQLDGLTTTVGKTTGVHNFAKRTYTK